MGLLSGHGASLATDAIGSVSQFALNLGSGLINQAFAKRNARIQQEYNRNLMKYQNELQQKNIKEQNEYNSPVAQMQRLSEAGLNPNLAYGTINTGNQSNVPTVNSPAPANFQNTNGGFEKLNQYIDLLGKFAQVQKTINDTNITDINSQVERWKLENLLPLTKREYFLRNLGLGYDNSVKYHRSLKASDIVDAELRYQTNLADKMWSDSMLSYYQQQTYPEEWKLRKTAMRLANSKERTAIANMKTQNLMLDLSYTFDKWAKAQLKAAGIIPGINSTTTESSSHGIKILGNGGNASTSATYTGPIKFRSY